MTTGGRIACIRFGNDCRKRDCSLTLQPELCVWSVDRKACHKILRQALGGLFIHAPGIPCLDGAEVGRRNEIAAIVGNAQASNHTLMGESRNDQWINLRPVERHQLPLSNSAVCSSAEHESTIRCKHHGILFGLWLAERIETLSTRNMPDLDRCTSGTCRRQQLSIRTEVQVKHRARRGRSFPGSSPQFLHYAKLSADRTQPWRRFFRPATSRLNRGCRYGRRNSLNRVLPDHDLHREAARKARHTGGQQNSGPIRRKTQAIYFAVRNRKAPDKLVVFDASLFNELESTHE